jgi:hypothetical protein
MVKTHLCGGINRKVVFTNNTNWIPSNGIQFVVIKEGDIFSTIASKVSEEGVYAYCGSDRSIEWVDTKFITAEIADIDMASLVFPFVSFDIRVKFSRLLESKVLKRFGGFLGTNLIFATSSGWKALSGFHNALIKTAKVEADSKILVINLFAMYYPNHISPLQQRILL